MRTDKANALRGCGESGYRHVYRTSHHGTTCYRALIHRVKHIGYYPSAKAALDAVIEFYDETLGDGWEKDRRKVLNSRLRKVVSVSPKS